MTDNPFDNTHLSNIAVVLAAHGSPLSSAHGTPTLALAKQLSNMKIFSSVGCGFLEQEPKIDTVINNLSASNVYIVPVLTCKGYIAGTKLPRALELTGAVTERIGPNGRMQIHMTEPLGVSEEIPTIVSKMFIAAMNRMNVLPENASTIIVGHGSMQSRASFEQTSLIAEVITNNKESLNVKAAFLEERPRIGDWQKIAPTGDVFVLPIMISDGHHATRDIPKEIGIEPDIKFDDAISSGVAGPYEIDGRKVYMLAPLGETAEMLELVISTVKQAIKSGQNTA